MRLAAIETPIRRGALIVVLLALPWTAGAAEVEVFRGEYVWKVDGHRNRVQATFTPTGDGQWDVELSFAYARRQDTYRGQAEGSLSRGAIHCNVEDDGGILRYRVEAEVDGDSFEGRHYDIYSGRRKLNGTIHLERVRDGANGEGWRREGEASSQHARLRHQDQPAVALPTSTRENLRNEPR